MHSCNTNWYWNGGALAYSNLGGGNMGNSYPCYVGFLESYC